MKIENLQIDKFKAHPLGFYYLLLRSNPRNSTRLHVYSGDKNFKADNSWHTHEFNLHSAVLAGSIRNDIGRFQETTDGKLHEFSVSYTEAKSIITPTGRTGDIQTTAHFTCDTGQSYFLAGGEIHQATCYKSPCVTLVHFEHRGLPILSYGKQESPFHRRAITLAEVSEISRILESVNILEIPEVEL